MVKMFPNAIFACDTDFVLTSSGRKDCCLAAAIQPPAEPPCPEPPHPLAPTPPHNAHALVWPPLKKALALRPKF